MRKYKLLKDLPDAAKGDIYIKGMNSDRYWNEKVSTTDKSPVIERNAYFTWQVENNTEWFEEIKEKEPTPDTFQVPRPPLGIIPERYHKETRLHELNEAIKRYADAKLFVPLTWIAEAQGIKMWIESRKEEELATPTNQQQPKTTAPQSSNSLEKEKRMPPFGYQQPQPKTDRIKILDLRCNKRDTQGNGQYVFESTRPLYPKDFPLIKQAIEQVLNNEKSYFTLAEAIQKISEDKSFHVLHDFVYNELILKKYSEAELTDREEKAFWAHDRYPTFNDYINSLNK